MNAQTALDPETLAHDTTSFKATVKYGRVVPGTERYLYDVVDRERTNLAFESCEVAIHDAMPKREQLALDTHGFALLHHVSRFAGAAAGPAAVAPEAEVLKQNYLAEMVEFVRSISGTPHVFAQPNGFLIRHGKRSEVKTAARPASFAHTDFTPRTASEMAELILKGQREPLPKFREFALFQTWRAVSPPPQDTLLTFCDPRTVKDEDCLLIDSIVGPENEPGNVFQMKLGLSRPWHRWYYFSGLTAADVIVFMAHDSRRAEQPNVLHTSFVNPLAGPDSVPRASIEARLFAYFV